MALEIIGMWAASTGGTQDAVAQIDVPQDGVLRGIDWDIRAALDAAENYDAEFSFIATNQLAANDVRGRISSIGVTAAIVTAVGAVVVSLQKWIGGFELMLSGGERLYLHVQATAGVMATARLNLHFDGGAAVTRRSARR